MKALYYMQIMSNLKRESVYCMGVTVYTNYWVNNLNGMKKEHGSYKTEKEACDGIFAWWEIHNESYNDIEYVRTNRGALEVVYGSSDYYYRIEASETDEPLPNTNYTVKKPGEIEALRSKFQLDEDTFLFDELAEPYRDRLIIAMGDIKKVRSFTYTKEGRPIIELEMVR